jgi:hypothetical protein
MNAKRKPASPKDIWQIIRRRYTWHLREREFDRSHWWKKAPNAGPIAACYELARRHPLVETPPAIITFPGSEPPIPIPPLSEFQLSLHCTRCLAMKSWPNLTDAERTQWKSSIRKARGLDLRPDEAVCRNLTSLADSAIPQRRVKAVKAAADSLPPELVGMSAFGLYLDPTDEEREAAIAEAAIEAYRQGYLLLAVAPGLATEKLQDVVSKKYREHFGSDSPPKRSQRARWQDWLSLISEFEDDEDRRGGAKNQVFARYRRTVDQIRFLYRWDKV